jgi:hypothetical protein
VQPGSNICCDCIAACYCGAQWRSSMCDIRKVVAGVLCTVFAKTLQGGYLLDSLHAAVVAPPPRSSLRHHHWCWCCIILLSAEGPQYRSNWHHGMLPGDCLTLSAVVACRMCVELSCCCMGHYYVYSVANWPQWCTARPLPARGKGKS